MTLENFRSSFVELEELGPIVVVHVTRAQLNDEENIEQFGRDLVSLVEQHERSRLVLDLEVVQYATSSVIGKIISLHRRMQRANGRLVICNVGETLAKTLATASLMKYFNVAADVPAALATFDEGN